MDTFPLDRIDAITDCATIGFDRIRATILDFHAGTGRPRQQALRQTLATVQAGSRRDFYGADLDAFAGWLRDGYSVPALAGTGDVLDKVQDVHPRYSDSDGEIDFAEMWSGAEDFYLDTPRDERMPGLDVSCEIAFLGFTPVNVITEYGAWIFSVLAALDAAGYDYSLTVDHPSARDVYRGARKTNARVVLKNRGEFVDTAYISPMFAPGAFRVLGFTARALFCDDTGRTCSTGYGASLPGSWDVTLDRDGGRLHISRPNNAVDFPAAEMTEKFLALGIV